MSTRALRWLAAGIISALFLLSFHLAAHRIIQVDEAQNMFMARVIQSGQTDLYFVNPALFLLGPLGWIAGAATSTQDAFFGGRMLFLGVFWLNIFLLIKCTGVSLRTQDGLLVAVAAATLAPVWDYGFEIRHDNLLLTGLLTIWYLGRHVGSRAASFFFIGALVCVLQFVAFKSFVYSVPVSLYLLVRQGTAEPERLRRIVASWVLGVGIGSIACVLVYMAHDLLGVLTGSTLAVKDSAQSAVGFYPFKTLARPLSQTPLLVATATAALISVLSGFFRSPQAALRKDNCAPEGALLLVAIFALFVNPTPFPYNLVNVVPFAFLLACRYLRTTLSTTRPLNRQMLLLGACLVAFSHFAPFWKATERHLGMTNWRQLSLAQAAEAMTDPAVDPVYDAVGMVLTRPSIGRWWYLHSMSMRHVYDGKQASAAEMLATRPAAVLMPNYRFNWLPKSDWQFIQKNYVPLADDFWVLGARLPSGGGDFRVLRSGRYMFVTDGPGQVASPQVTIDGTPVASAIVNLSAGTHDIRLPPDEKMTVVWLGPKLRKLPAIPPGDHNTLFKNWY
jgi:hypothetical protein